MEKKRIDPEKYPLKSGERWWIVHPNSKAEFKLPFNAVSLCKENFLDFKKNTAYKVLSSDLYGWVDVVEKETVYEMPQYIFARHFDAEAFIVGQYDPAELERAVPFDYRPTVPKKGIYTFKDKEEN